MEALVNSPLSENILLDGAVHQKIFESVRVVSAFRLEFGRRHNLGYFQKRQRKAEEESANEEELP